MVHDSRLVKAIFNLVKAKLKKESLLITPNLIHFIALKLLNQHQSQSLLVKIERFLASSDNKI